MFIIVGSKYASSLHNIKDPGFLRYFDNVKTSQPAITCSTLTAETLEQGAKYVQS